MKLVTVEEMKEVARLTDEIEHMQYKLFRLSYSVEQESRLDDLLCELLAIQERIERRTNK